MKIVDVYLKDGSTHQHTDVISTWVSGSFFVVKTVNNLLHYASESMINSRQTPNQ